MSFEDLREGVLDQGLCCGCGTCVSVCPHGWIRLSLGEIGADFLGEDCGKCELCSKACPGAFLPMTEMEKLVFGRSKKDDERLLGIYEQHFITHAADEKIHRAGVAGGSVSAMLAYGLEKGMIDGAIVANFDKNEPWKVKPIVATTVEEVLSSARSKYGICSVNAALLEAVEMGLKEIAVVGVPCHVWGIRKMQLQKISPKITKRIKYVIGLYCLAQNYSLAAEYLITQRMGVALEDVAEFQYRGGELFGGGAWVRTKGGQERSIELLANWGMVPTVFIGYQTERCLVCLDHLAELADLSCGDVWGRHQELEQKSKYGWTGIFVRTKRGTELFRNAVQAGYIHAELEQDIVSYYAVNPGHSKKRFANPRRIEYREKYGWPVPVVE